MKLAIAHIKSWHQFIRERDGHGIRGWTRRNPEKVSAQRRVQKALTAGKMRRGKLCRRCRRRDDALHAHHEDYSKPFAVIFLCPSCHGERHRQIRDAKKAGVEPPPFKRKRPWKIRMAEWQRQWAAEHAAREAEWAAILGTLASPTPHEPRR